MILIYPCDNSDWLQCTELLSRLFRFLFTVFVALSIIKYDYLRSLTIDLRGAHILSLITWRGGGRFHKKINSVLHTYICVDSDRRKMAIFIGGHER